MSAFADVQGHTAAEQKLLAGCEARIARHRMASLAVTVRDAQGRPAPGVQVRVRQLRHAFLFGCNVFALDSHKRPRLNTRYAERFADLLNYATLPFYWGAYEPEPGQTGEARLMAMADWCAAHGIVTKGHPLVWHEVVPKWLGAKLAGLTPAKAVATTEGLLRDRVRGIVAQYAGKVDRWDVINEATVSERFDNGVGAWVRKRGETDAVARSLRWAREAGPEASLVVNDFNVWPEAFPEMLSALGAAGAPYDVIGLQSHMHAGTQPFTKWWQVCRRYARFGKPLHFTELTVLSGALKTDDDWNSHRAGWDTTPEGEGRQAEYVANLYRLLFSHPAIAAITWWDFSDAGAWQGAPAGFLRKDMSPKPVYGRLLDLIKHQWWTDDVTRTDAAGRVALTAFLGDYQVSAGVGRARVAIEGTLAKGRRNEWTLSLP